MSLVAEFLGKIDVNRPRFEHELYKIGRLPTLEAKSAALRGRLDLAVSALVTWDDLQRELREIPGLGDIQSLINDELREVKEKEPLEHELVLLKDKHLPWYERERAKDYWNVANEMADVLVFVVGKMRRSCPNDPNSEEVMAALMGRSEYIDKPLINEMIARTAALGMDLAEIMILKTEVNFQHRDSGLLPWVRGDGFMKEIRRSIGNADSQIPHLAQGFLGETVLTRLQAPKLMSGERVDLSNLKNIFAHELLNRASMFVVN
ncbi:TPA: hypothetical protein DD448_01105 [Candidatus Collierbacteria bacterium]|nr:MAG: hypothetical protein UX32_C0013G0014 [Microgenomates group bacterium GW2011_GWF1_46_12]KKU43600.1 MAG: hypothetical protein UX59_C0013G0006 [Microgenomates group bacterium GW2011_GWA1_46_7]KKU45102.1 MAG: hypothetical protein UX63_C0012G0006 [Microgenomates group bacterium GW2011_GWB1_46_7]KKU62431.1 MAG: hypothetical protein UX84_C0007G0017 [Microgenomates group bacterium GW2011_GWD1_47_13]HBD02031.1 hypothetical protein [Candidatus Collierbacteria bacterium]